MSWFHKLLPSSIRLRSKVKKDVPEGLWTRCPSCEKMLFNAELDRLYRVCSHCQHHFPLSPLERKTALLDETYDELFGDINPVDSLKFKDTKRYKDRLKVLERTHRSSEA